VYAVLDHASWAEKNPGKCTTKIEMPWAAESPELGRQLHAIAAGRVKFRPEQIRYLQEHFTDEEIERGFRKLLETRSVPLDGNGVIYMKNLDWEALCWDE
jgi:hypothetical protein